MRRLILTVGAATALLAVAPAFAQTAGATGQLGVTTNGVVPNPPAVTGSTAGVNANGVSSTTTGTLGRGGKTRQGAQSAGSVAGSGSTETTTGASAGSINAGGALGASPTGSYGRATTGTGPGAAGGLGGASAGTTGGGAGAGASGGAGH